MALGGWTLSLGVVCAILANSLAALSTTSSPAGAASSIATTTATMMAAAWSVVQLGAVMLPGGLQPMTSMLEQHLLQMAAARDPSWIAMCDGFKHDTRDDCRWHRLAGRSTWSAGLARSRGRQVDGDGRVEVNLMAAALLLVSESVLATVRSDFAEVAVINGTASTQVTPGGVRAALPALSDDQCWHS